MPLVLLYRTIFAVFCCGWLIGSVIYSRDRGPKWLIYLSNWSFFFVTLYFICATIVTAIHYRKQRHDPRNRVENDVKDLASRETSHNGYMPSFPIDTRDDAGDVAHDADDEEASRVFPMAWFHEALWVIYNIAAVAALLVTLTYWALLFRLVNNLRALTVVVHGVNSVLMIGDTMLSSIPVRLFHVIYPMFYSIIYIVFTVIYWAVGGTSYFDRPYIYPQTDYTGRPVLSTVSQVSLFVVGLPLCQSVLFGFYMLRVWIKTKCGK